MAVKLVHIDRFGKFFFCSSIRSLSTFNFFVLFLIIITLVHDECVKWFLCNKDDDHNDGLQIYECEYRVCVKLFYCGQNESNDSNYNYYIFESFDFQLNEKMSEKNSTKKNDHHIVCEDSLTSIHLTLFFLCVH